MDEEEFYRNQKNYPKRHTTYQPFGYGPVLNSGNRKWAKWFARVMLFLLLLPLIMLIVGILISFL